MRLPRDMRGSMTRPTPDYEHYMILGMTAIVFASFVFIQLDCSTSSRPAKTQRFTEVFFLESEIPLESSDSCLVVRICKSLCFYHGRIYIADEVGKQVLVFDRSGKFIQTLGRLGHARDEFEYPREICVLSPGRLFIYDVLRNYILELDTLGRFKSGVFLTKYRVHLWGKVSGRLLVIGPNLSTRGDMTASFVSDSGLVAIAHLESSLELPRLTGRMTEPYDVPSDEDGNFFFVEPGSLRIIKFSSRGKVLAISKEVPNGFSKVDHDLERSDVDIEEVTQALRDYTPVFGLCYVSGHLFVTWKDSKSSEGKRYVEVYNSELQLVSTKIEIPRDLYPFIFTDGLSVFFLGKSQLTKEGNYLNPVLKVFRYLDPIQNLKFSER